MSSLYTHIDKEIINFQENPDWLACRASNGIIEVNFFPEEPPIDRIAQDRLEKFIKYGLDLSTQNQDDKNIQRADFRLLDTSMSDSSDILEEIFERAREIQKLNKKSKGYRFLRLNTIPIIWLLLQEIDFIAGILLLKKLVDRGTVNILLADPESNFAQTRAKSISRSEEDYVFLARHKTYEGLWTIAEQVYLFLEFLKKDLDEFKDSVPKNPEKRLDADLKEEIEILLNYINKYGKVCGLKLLFYSEVPSGPMYFLQNILIQGRYCSGYSATKLPWMAIINNPKCDNDFYDIFSDEFQRIWEKSLKLNYNLPGKITDETSRELEKLRQENRQLRQENEELSRDNKELRHLIV